jgi:hypothetical protein
MLHIPLNQLPPIRRRPLAGYTMRRDEYAIIAWPDDRPAG